MVFALALQRHVEPMPHNLNFAVSLKNGPYPPFRLVLRQNTGRPLGRPRCRGIHRPCTGGQVVLRSTPAGCEDSGFARVSPRPLGHLGLWGGIKLWGMSLKRGWLARRLLDNSWGVRSPLTERHQGSSSQLRGPDRDRTGNLLVANQALSQLSYGPVVGESHCGGAGSSGQGGGFDSTAGTARGGR
jgi:hypothetical protein